MGLGEKQVTATEIMEVILRRQGQHTGTNYMTSCVLNKGRGDCNFRSQFSVDNNPV